MTQNKITVVGGIARLYKNTTSNNKKKFQTPQNKFMVVSGFLGAGKTTTMIALSQYINQHIGKAVIIANDLGAKNLVDADYTSITGCSVTPIAGGCICFQTENLVDKLRGLRDDYKADIVMSDIPGCGVGALDHVYHKLNKEYTGEFELAPFTVIVDPERLRMITAEKADLNLPKEMIYLLESQLEEADVVVLNKTDLLSDKETENYLTFLRTACPGIPVFAISAKEKQNIKEVAEYIMSHRASLKVVDLDYGGKDFVAAESKLSWFNRQVFLKSKDGSALDGNALVDDLIEAVRKKLQEKHRNVPHLKIFTIGAENDFAKASLLGVDYDIIRDKKLEQKSDKFKIIVNVRAACESQLLNQIMDEALAETAKQHQISYQIFFSECFGMMDEGKLE